MCRRRETLGRQFHQLTAVWEKCYQRRLRNCQKTSLMSQSARSWDMIEMRSRLGFDFVAKCSESNTDNDGWSVGWREFCDARCCCWIHLEVNIPAPSLPPYFCPPSALSERVGALSTLTPPGILQMMWALLCLRGLPLSENSTISTRFVCLTVWKSPPVLVCIQTSRSP